MYDILAYLFENCQQAAVCNPGRQFRVAAWVDHVDACAEHRDGGTRAGQPAAVRSRIDAEREA